MRVRSAAIGLVIALSSAGAVGQPAAPGGPASTPDQVAPASPAAPVAAYPAPADAPLPASGPPTPEQAQQGASPGTAAAPAEPAPTPTPIPAATPPSAPEQRVPETPIEDPARVRATTPVDEYHTLKDEDPTKTRLVLELGAGVVSAGHFPSDSVNRSNQEAIDGAFGFSAFLGSRSAIYGLGVERIGLGRDHFGTSFGSITSNASYLVDTLWLQGRWYFSETRRPAIYVGAALGPAVARVKATGTRASDTPLVSPPEPYQCSETGKVGLGLAASIGAEFGVGGNWSFLSDARLAGHVLSRDSSEFGACAPATGSAISGTLRLGLQLRL